MFYKKAKAVPKSASRWRASNKYASVQYTYVAASQHGESVWSMKKESAAGARRGAARGRSPGMQLLLEQPAPRHRHREPLATSPHVSLINFKAAIKTIREDFKLFDLCCDLMKCISYIFKT